MLCLCVCKETIRTLQVLFDLMSLWRARERCTQRLLMMCVPVLAKQLDGSGTCEAAPRFRYLRSSSTVPVRAKQLDSFCASVRVFRIHLDIRLTKVCICMSNSLFSALVMTRSFARARSPPSESASRKISATSIWSKSLQQASGKNLYNKYLVKISATNIWSKSLQQIFGQYLCNKYLRIKILRNTDRILVICNPMWTRDRQSHGRHWYTIHKQFQMEIQRAHHSHRTPFPR